MKITCLIGSPRQKSNSAAIAGRFMETAASLGAQTETIVLNSLSYRGCQACMACKTTSERCVLQDDLTDVLESLKSADAVVMALPVYCSDVPGQFKCFLDRTYSYMKPNYLAESNPSRVPWGNACLNPYAGGARGKFVCRHPAAISGISETFHGFRRDLFDTRCRSRRRGISRGSDQYLQQAEEAARSIMKA
jgi:multimeric flavodoxin WrbA